MKATRRDFIKKAATGAAAVSVGGVFTGFSAGSYNRIIGANERIHVAMMGVHSRGLALSRNYAKLPGSEVIYVCDVDSRSADKCISEVTGIQGNSPKASPDFRKALEDKNLDALVVAAPDHWHAPAAILACSAGKHVYLEKPCSHNPAEGELLVAASKKYNRVVQMGNQNRSCPNIIAAMEELHSGIIGRPYFARAWYSNNRKSIGRGVETAVPSWLNYELWQGPAPRRAYKDNVIHYNWHWFWHWGTGEALNNGTHMVDLARWGLGVTYPTRVSSSGGRYRYNDDWETPDTQVITMEFGGKASIMWEGRSCNGKPEEGSGDGVIFYGETGSMLINECDSVSVFDLDGNIVKEYRNESLTTVKRDLMDPSRSLDALHIQNFFDGIRKGVEVNSAIQGGHQSTLLVQLGNIAQRSGNTLHTDPENGHILNDPGAMKYWGREYEPGWEPTI
jgi:predicted dehydrogenase